MNVSLVLTHACNLACDYCYTGDKKRVFMPASLALEAVDAALAEAEVRGAPLTLGFFGGEPLLAWDLLVATSRAARAAAEATGTPLALQVTTNGLLLTDARARALAELGVWVALSLDGTPEAHDRHRRAPGGAGSYAGAREALEHLLRHAPERFDVIMVLTPETVSEASLGARALFDAGVTRLTLNPHWGAPWSPEARDALVRELERMAALVLAWRRRGREVTLEPLESAMRALREGGPAAACRAGLDGFAVAPSGRIYGCGRAVGEDLGHGALGLLTRHGFSRERREELEAEGSSRACSCAHREALVDGAAPDLPSWHDAVMADLATRLARALERDGAKP